MNNNRNLGWFLVPVEVKRNYAYLFSDKKSRDESVTNQYQRYQSKWSREKSGKDSFSLAEEAELTCVDEG